MVCGNIFILHFIGNVFFLKTAPTPTWLILKNIVISQFVLTNNAVFGSFLPLSPILCNQILPIVPKIAPVTETEIIKEDPASLLHHLCPAPTPHLPVYCAGDHCPRAGLHIRLDTTTRPLRPAATRSHITLHKLRKLNQGQRTMSLLQLPLSVIYNIYIFDANRVSEQ